LNLFEGFFHFWATVLTVKTLIYLIDVNCSFDMLGFLTKVKSIQSFLVIDCSLSHSANNRSL